MPGLRGGPWSSKWRGFALALGEGGQGEVHKVISVFGSEVGILKHMKRELGQDRKARSRMYRESKIIERFGLKSNLPRLLDSNCGQFDQVSVPLYFVTHFIGGVTLDRYLAMHARFYADDAIGIVIKLLDAVEWLHGLDWPILHRDIKPKNIIMNSKGDPVLIDFGLAYTNYPDSNQNSSVMSDADEDLDTLTEHNESVGNNFLSLPERAMNKRDPRSDIAMCCGILFYLLTGEDPKHLNTPPHKRANVSGILNKLNPSDHAILNGIFDWGFEFEVSDRFQTASELREALEEALQNLTVVSPSAALTKSPLSEYGPVQQTIGDRLLNYQNQLNDLLLRLVQMAHVDETQLNGMTFLEALDLSRESWHFGGERMIEQHMYDDIHEFISKEENPQRGDDEYLLVWYPAIISYLQYRFSTHDDSVVDYLMDLEKDSK